VRRRGWRRETEGVVVDWCAGRLLRWRGRHLAAASEDGAIL
jgi:hypothetical protein